VCVRSNGIMTRAFAPTHKNRHTPPHAKSQSSKRGRYSVREVHLRHAPGHLFHLLALAVRLPSIPIVGASLVQA